MAYLTYHFTYGNMQITNTTSMLNYRVLIKPERNIEMLSLSSILWLTNAKTLLLIIEMVIIQSIWTYY
jgi:hypothetical protein